MHVRLVLEYCCPIWGSLINGRQKQELELIQKRCVSIILGASASSHAKNLAKLELCTLEERRFELTRTFAFKVLVSHRHSFWFTHVPHTGVNTRPHIPGYIMPKTRPPRYIIPKTRTIGGSGAPISFMTSIINELSDEDFDKYCQGAKPPPPAPIVD